MNLFFHHFDLVPILVVGDALTLPDPKAFASVGWLLVGIWTLVKIADGILNFYKRHIKQSIPSGDWASQKDLEKLRTDVHNQLTEARDYNHNQIHEVKVALQTIQTSGDTGREGLHSRLNTVIEVVAELRGEMRGMVVAVKASSDAAQLAGQSATRAAERADELSRRVH